MDANHARTDRSVIQSARVHALQALYEADLVGHDPRETLERLTTETESEPDITELAQRLVEGVVAHRSELDAAIGQAAPAWPIEQMPPIDKNVLRLAIFELLHDNRRVPTKAAITEAVELAKRYGSDHSGRFVNGVLGTIASTKGRPG